MKVWLQNTCSCEVAAFENDYEATLVVSSSDKKQFQSQIIQFINRIVSYNPALNIITVIMITKVDQLKSYLNLVHFLNFLEEGQKLFKSPVSSFSRFNKSILIEP